MKGRKLSKDQTVFRIKVEQDDIDWGIARNSNRCVVARAVARIISDATHFSVDMQTIRFSRGTQRYVYITPESVMNYIVAFDAGDEIEPFKFMLRAPTLHERKIKNRTTIPETAPTSRPRGRSIKIGNKHAPPKARGTNRGNNRTYGRRVMRENQGGEE